MMRITIAAISSAVLLAASAQDEREQVAKAAEKTGALENYKFTGKIVIEGVPFFADPIDFNGTYVKDKGFLANVGPLGTIFRLDKKVAAKDPDGGKWYRIERDTRVGEGPLAEEIPVVARELKPPHEELKKFETRFKEIKKRDGTELIGGAKCVIYEGPLTEEGVRALLPGSAASRLEKAKIEGTGRAWVGPDGRIVRLHFDSKIKIEQEDLETEIAISRTTEFTDVGKATIEAPTEVTELFKK